MDDSELENLVNSLDRTVSGHIRISADDLELENPTESLNRAVSSYIWAMIVDGMIREPRYWEFYNADLRLGIWYGRFFYFVILKFTNFLYNILNDTCIINKLNQVYDTCS